MSDLPMEASPGDVAEQRAEVVPDQAGRPPSAIDLPLEADPADAVDQLVEVPLADDDY